MGKERIKMDRKIKKGWESALYDETQHDEMQGDTITDQSFDGDSINPSHYKDTEIEFIDYAKASMSKERFEGFLEGNIKKYMHRWSTKNENGLECLMKAEWYMKKLINEVSDG